MIYLVVDFSLKSKMSLIWYPDIWGPFVYWSLHLWFTCFDAEVSHWRDVCSVMLRCGINVRDYLWPPSPLFIFTSAAAYPPLTLHHPVSNNKHWQKFRGGDRKNLITTSLPKGTGREQAREDQSWIPRELDILVNFPNTRHRTRIWQPAPSASNCHNISCVFSPPGTVEEGCSCDVWLLSRYVTEYRTCVITHDHDIFGRDNYQIHCLCCFSLYFLSK